MSQTETLVTPETRRESPLYLLWRDETLSGAIFSPRFLLANLLLALIPDGVFSRLRGAVYRFVWGIPVGKGAVIIGRIRFASPHLAARHVRIGSRAIMNVNVFIDAAAPVTIGDGVSIAHDVRLITTNHEIGCAEFRAARRVEKPVVVGAGAWVAAGAMVLPGVEIGAGAVVAAGAVVTKSVAENTLVAGVPARKVRDL